MTSNVIYAGNVFNKFCAVFFYAVAIISVIELAEGASNWGARLYKVPDPRIDAASCGLERVTTKYRLCDPETLLSPEAQSSLTNKLKQIELTRCHECNDGTITPLSISVILASSVLHTELGGFDQEFSEIFLEQVLQQIKPDQSGSRLPHNHFRQSKCGSHIAIMISPSNEPPILSIRCDNSVEAVFQENEYDDLYKNSLSAYSSVDKTAVMNLTNVVGTTVKEQSTSLNEIPLINKINRLVEFIGNRYPQRDQFVNENNEEINNTEFKTALKTSKNEVIKIAKKHGGGNNNLKTDSGMKNIASIINSIEGEYEESLGDLELAAEKQLAKAIEPEEDKQTSKTTIFTRKNIRAMIIVALVFILWNSLVEVLHQILLRKFSPSKASLAHNNLSESGHFTNRSTRNVLPTVPQQSYTSVLEHSYSKYLTDNPDRRKDEPTRLFPKPKHRKHAAVLLADTQKHSSQSLEYEPEDNIYNSQASAIQTDEAWETNFDL